MAGLAARSNEDRPLAGIALVLFAYLVFSFVDTGSKWLGLLGLSALQLSFMRYLVHFLITCVVIQRQGFTRDLFLSDHLWLVVLRALMLMVVTVMNFITIRYLPLTITSTLLFSAPIFVCMLSWPILGERVGPWRWFAIFVGFVGVLVVIRPFGEALHWAALLSLANAVFFAVFLVLTRKLADTVAADTLQFYTGFVGTIALMPFGISQWVQPQTEMQWAVLLGFGAFAWFGHGILIRANNFAPASFLTPFGYSMILYLTVWSYFLFGDVPDFWTLIGASIIIGSGLIIWWRERLAQKRAIKVAPPA